MRKQRRIAGPKVCNGSGNLTGSPCVEDSPTLRADAQRERRRRLSHMKKGQFDDDSAPASPRSTASTTDSDGESERLTVEPVIIETVACVPPQEKAGDRRPRYTQRERRRRLSQIKRGQFDDESTPASPRSTASTTDSDGEYERLAVEPVIIKTFAFEPLNADSTSHSEVAFEPLNADSTSHSEAESEPVIETVACVPPKEEAAGRRIRYTPSERVLLRYICSCRVGVVLEHDPDDDYLTYKLSFEDGHKPSVDWVAGKDCDEVIEDAETPAEAPAELPAEAPAEAPEPRYAPEGRVGLRHKPSDRIGIVLEHDPGDDLLTYKVRFEDGQTPSVDWVAGTDVEQISEAAMPKSPLCLVLDIDGTLLSESDDVCVETMHLLLRPGMKEFLDNAFESFTAVAIWTAGSRTWLEAFLDVVDPDRTRPWAFTWSSERTSWQKVEDDEGEVYLQHVKRLRKIWQSKTLRALGYSERTTLIIDNNPSVCIPNYGNAVYIETYEDDEDHSEQKESQEVDDWLPILSDYLKNVNLHQLPGQTVRQIDKRDWYAETKSLAVRGTRAHTI